MPTGSATACLRLYLRVPVVCVSITPQRPSVFARVSALASWLETVDDIDPVGNDNIETPEVLPVPGVVTGNTRGATVQVRCRAHPALFSGAPRAVVGPTPRCVCVCAGPLGQHAHAASCVSCVPCAGVHINRPLHADRGAGHAGYFH